MKCGEDTYGVGQVRRDLNVILKFRVEVATARVRGETALPRGS